MLKFVNISGFTGCKFFEKAKSAFIGLALIYSEHLSIEVHEYQTRDEYMAWLMASREALGII